MHVKEEKIRSSFVGNSHPAEKISSSAKALVKCIRVKFIKETLEEKYTWRENQDTDFGHVTFQIPIRPPNGVVN